MSSQLIVNNINPEIDLTIDGNVATTGAIDSPDLKIDNTSLGEKGTIADTTSGASKIGVYNEFNHSSSDSVQSVLKDYDDALGEKQSKVITGTGAPTIVPEGVGQFYVDTVGQALYVATGNSSTQDWVGQDNGLKLGYNFPGGFAGWVLVANDLHCAKVFAPMDAVIRRIGVYFQSFNPNIKFVMGIYSDDDGSPRFLLGQSDEFTTTHTGSYEQIFLDLLDPVRIEKDTVYWLAFHSDGNINVERLKGNSICGKYQTITYQKVLPTELTITGTTSEMSISAW